MTASVQDLDRLLGLTVDASEGEEVILTGKIAKVASYARVLTLRGCMFAPDALQSAHLWRTNTISLNDRMPPLGLSALAAFEGVQRLKLENVGQIPVGELRACLEAMSCLEDISIVSPCTRAWACFDLCSALVRSCVEVVHIELGEVDRMTHSRCMGVLGSMYLREQYVSFSGVV